MSSISEVSSSYAINYCILHQYYLHLFYPNRCHPFKYCRHFHTCFYDLIFTRRYATIAIDKVPMFARNPEPNDQFLPTPLFTLFALSGSATRVNIIMEFAIID